MAFDLNFPTGGAGVSAGGSPVVAQKSSRHESRLALDLNVRNTAVSEDISVRDSTDRALDVQDDIDWTDVICDRRELLDESCRELIKQTATCLMYRDTEGRTVQDRDNLRLKAEQLWLRALSIPDDCKEALEAEKCALISKFNERQGRARQQYARAAGSSLNSLVLDWGAFDEQQLIIELKAIAAKYHFEGVRLQSDALQTGFNATNVWAQEFNQNQVGRAISLLGVLRGSLDIAKRDQVHDEVRVRDEDEDIDRSTNTGRSQNTFDVNFNTQWHNVAIDSDEAGTYAGKVGEIEAAQASVTPPVFP